MLKNAPTLAIVAVDTAENGPSKVRQVTNKVSRNLGVIVRKGETGAYHLVHEWTETLDHSAMPTAFKDFPLAAVYRKWVRWLANSECNK